MPKTSEISLISLVYINTSHICILHYNLNLELLNLYFPCTYSRITYIMINYARIKILSRFINQLASDSFDY